MSPEEARDALARARAGDQDAWTALYEAFTPLMERCVARYGGRAADAEGIVQDAWSRVVVWIQDPAHTVRSVKGWLVRTVCNQWIDSLRRKKARGVPSRYQPPTGFEPAADKRPSPASALVHREIEGIFAEVLTRLSPTEREIIRLVAELGMDSRAAGLHLGISAASANKRLLRAERRCRRMLRDELGRA